MASPTGNPAAPFDMHKLFKPPNPNPNPSAPFAPPSSYPPPSPYQSPAPPLAGGPFTYPSATPQFHHHPFLHYPVAPQNPNPNPNPSPNPNPGARLMALLGGAAPPPIESAASMPPPSPLPSPPAPLQAAQSAPLAPIPQPSLPSSKTPRGRLLGPGDRVVYDVDSRFPGESQPPQLEVTPITKYISDPGLVLGRQIAVNRAYICYGLKLGNIRILNINTALRELLRGHTQRVTDMAFFAEDVHLLASAGVDGRVYVWKIDEGPGGEGGKPQITGKAVIAIQIVGDEASYHPRICWHSHKQEILVVAIGNCVLKVDTTKVGKGKEFSAEEPLKCPIDKLIDGVQLIGRHDGEVTDLSISQWMTTRLVSASKDGTVKIWEDRKATPLVTLRPHYGQPVNSVEFLTSPHRPDHIVLVTAGPLNREVKIWASTSEEGWLLPSDSESWQCTQTLELTSSAEPQPEEAFFNQLAVLPRGSLLLVANAKKNSIYAVHIDYGACPASTRMDYIADFSVAMPILSLTGTCDCLPNGDQVVQVYCFQTHAIQQYALDLSQCLPPPNDNTVSEKDSCNSRGFDASKATLPGSSSGIAHSAIYRATSGSSDITNISDRTTSNAEAKLTTSLSGENVDAPFVASPSIPLNSDLSGRVSALGIPHKGLETRPSSDGRDVDHSILDYSVDMRVDSVTTNESVFPSIDGNSGKVGSKGVLNDNSMVPNPPLMFNLGGNSAHLITPAEILSGTIPQSENALINHAPKGDETKVQNLVSRNDVLRTEVEAELVGESRLNQNEEAGLQKQRNIPSEHKEKSFGSDISEPNYEKAKESCSLTTETSTVEVGTPLDDNSVTEALEQPSATREEDSEHSSSEPEKATESVVTGSPQSLSLANGKKQKEKQFEVSGPSSPSLSPSNSTEPESSADAPSTEAAFPQILAMQDKLNQLMTMQKEMQKQMSSIVAVPVTKEGRRVEASLGRSMEKAVKANTDALWARFQEENVKREKAEKDRMQQITGLITSCINKDLPAVLERVLKKEISTVAPSLARAVTPVIEKAISSAITDSFQRGVGDKAVNQLEKSVNSKLEASMSRQIQAQFQTSGKQALQDALKSNLETSVIPAFEVSCKAMFEQVDAVFQKGMTEYTSAVQQQFESTHTPLALTLRDAISSASSITQNMTSELADGQRKILTLLTAGNPKSSVPAAMQQSNGPIPGLPEMALTVQQVESPLDPTKELTRLISERKYDEAFTSALQRSNVTIVSWLCSQVDLHGICSMVPLPLSQGVLLALLQQLACDISNETPRKIGWMTSVAVAINPTDPMITLYVRPILEQVYNILAHQRSTPDIRAIMHVINSVLMSCK